MAAKVQNNPISQFQAPQRPGTPYSQQPRPLCRQNPLIVTPATCDLCERTTLLSGEDSKPFQPRQRNTWIIILDQRLRQLGRFVVMARDCRPLCQALALPFEPIHAADQMKAHPQVSQHSSRSYSQMQTVDIKAARCCAEGAENCNTQITRTLSRMPPRGHCRAIPP